MRERQRDTPGSRFTRWRTRIGDRLARSGRVFLIGVIVACGIEVVVDWNATLYEINVLRDGMRQRGMNYVSILAQAAVGPMLAYDVGALDSLSQGLFDDEDVVFVRFADQQAGVVYDRIRLGGRLTPAVPHEADFRTFYGPQLERDVAGILADPVQLRARIAHSAYRDLFQLWNDIVQWGVAKVAGAKTEPAHPHGALIYQDRLRDELEHHDKNVTWALGTIVDERDETWGVVLVAFSMARTNAAIDKKLLKGLGMVLFFVGLIIVQNVLSRRDKLRLLDLETRYANAKAALREALPEPHRAGAGLRIGLSLDQAHGPVDGMVYDVIEGPTATDLLVIDPDGDGIDAASTALHILKAFRERRSLGAPAPLWSEAQALGAAALVIPLTRPIGLLLARIDHATGAIEALANPLATLRLVGAGGIQPLSARASPGEAPLGVVGPLESLTGLLAPGSTLVAVCAGMETSETRRGIGPASVVEYVHRTRQQGKVSFDALASDATTWARGRMSGMATQDIVVCVVERTS